MLVVTPPRKAAQVASGEVGAAAHSVAWLLHQHGYRWDGDGCARGQVAAMSAICVCGGGGADGGSCSYP